MAQEDIVGVELVLHVFSGLLSLVVGEAVAILRIALIPPLILELTIVLGGRIESRGIPAMLIEVLQSSGAHRCELGGIERGLIVGCRLVPRVIGIHDSKARCRK